MAKARLDKAFVAKVDKVIEKLEEPTMEVLRGWEEALVASITDKWEPRAKGGAGTYDCACCTQADRIRPHGDRCQSCGLAWGLGLVIPPYEVCIPSFGQWVCWQAPASAVLADCRKALRRVRAEIAKREATPERGPRPRT